MSARVVLYGLLVHLVTALVTGVPALAGSYGSVERRYAGFEAAIDISVGSMNPHSREGEEMARRKKEGEAELARREPELIAMYGTLSAARTPTAAFSAASTPPPTRRRTSDARASR